MPELRCPNGHYAEKSPEGLLYCDGPGCFCSWYMNDYLGSWYPSFAEPRGV